jgi:hypothetical protein
MKAYLARKVRTVEDRVLPSRSAGEHTHVFALAAVITFVIASTALIIGALIGELLL